MRGLKHTECRCRLPKSWPYELVSQAADIFKWPAETMRGQALAKELRQTRTLMVDHAERLFPILPKTGAAPTAKHLEIAAKDLIAIMKEIQKDAFWGPKLNTMSMVNTYIMHKIRSGARRVPAVQERAKTLLETI
jgi:hypothetical protein